MNEQVPARRAALLVAFFFAAVSAMTLGGCGNATDLEPSPAGTLVGKNTQRASASGVVLTAEVDRWDDHPAALRYVTPVWVSIANHSGQPIELRYRHFRVATPSGVNLAALPPYGIEGHVTVRVDEPAFLFDDFSVYRPVSSIYPRMPVTRYGAYDGGFYDYYGMYDDYWVDVPLPTPRMVALALPEGVIENGGSVTGYLYFPEIDDDDRIIEVGENGGKATVYLEVDLVEADGSEVLDTISMPFLVD